VQELLIARLAKDIRFLKRDWPFRGEAARRALYFGVKQLSLI
jgi:hypothetical protein